MKIKTCLKSKLLKIILFSSAAFGFFIVPIFHQNNKTPSSGTVLSKDSTLSFETTEKSFILNIGANGNIGIKEPEIETVLTDVKARQKVSHPLDNLCKYPILSSYDESILQYIKHPRRTDCSKVQEDYIIFDYETNEISINQDLAKSVLNVEIRCKLRILGGGLRPRRNDLEPLSDWIELDTYIPRQILVDQFEVKCSPENDNSTEVFSFAYAQIVKRPGVKYSPNTDARLSVDILITDSTSFNQFRRHMIKSFDYMKNVMGFYHLEGYNKVGDNSIVNIFPIMSGLRYLNHSYGNHSLPSDLPEDKVLDLESVNFIWNDFSAKGCPTMINDDVNDYHWGIFHYPWPLADGFRKNPVDYFFRPWHIRQRRYPVNGTSKFCFANRPYHQYQLELTERMIRTYDRTCHFSFTFVTQLSHDNPNDLERTDEDVYKMLKNLYENDHLNNTVLLVMGDHGQRIAWSRTSFVGRVEERMTFFSVYFPAWFRRLHPDLMANLEYNKHRLTSNFDVYRMLKDIVDERFDVEPRPAPKGVSLLSPISKDRSCFEANIPDNHCTCLETVRHLNAGDDLYRRSIGALNNYTASAFFVDKPAHCPTTVGSVELTVRNMTVYTTSQMIQAGVRSIVPEMMALLNKTYDLELEYVEILYDLEPWKLSTNIRLQHNKVLRQITVNAEPLFLNLYELCDNDGDSKNPICECFVRKKI